MLKTEFLMEIEPIKKHSFSCEKDTYNYVKNRLFRKSFKVFIPVLRGFPDFIVTEVDKLFKRELKAGFYEVKFKDRPLQPTQIKIIQELLKVAPCYIVRVMPDGLILIERVKNGEKD